DRASRDGDVEVRRPVVDVPDLVQAFGARGRRVLDADVPAMDRQGRPGKREVAAVVELPVRVRVEEHAPAHGRGGEDDVLRDLPVQDPVPVRVDGPPLRGVVRDGEGQGLEDGRTGPGSWVDGPRRDGDLHDAERGEDRI